MTTYDTNQQSVGSPTATPTEIGAAGRQVRRGRSSPAAINHAEREREAIVLRTAGLSYEEIGQRLGYRDRSGAKKAVERGLSRWMREADEELRAIMLERLERLVCRLWPRIDHPKPDLKAIDTFLRVTDLEARLSGAFAPRRQRLDVAVHARVEHGKLEALRVLEADAEIAEVIDDYLDHPRSEPSDG
jgi:hypothetical protein